MQCGCQASCNQSSVISHQSAISHQSSVIMQCGYQDICLQIGALLLQWNSGNKSLLAVYPVFPHPHSMFNAVSVSTAHPLGLCAIPQGLGFVQLISLPRLPLTLLPEHSVGMETLNTVFEAPQPPPTALLSFASPSPSPSTWWSVSSCV